MGTRIPYPAPDTLDEREPIEKLDPRVKQYVLKALQNQLSTKKSAAQRNELQEKLLFDLGAQIGRVTSKMGNVVQTTPIESTLPAFAADAKKSYESVFPGTTSQTGLIRDYLRFKGSEGSAEARKYAADSMREIEDMRLMTSLEKLDDELAAKAGSDEQRRAIAELKAATQERIVNRKSATEQELERLRQSGRIELEQERQKGKIGKEEDYQSKLDYQKQRDKIRLDTASKLADLRIKQAKAKPGAKGAAPGGGKQLPPGAIEKITTAKNGLRLARELQNEMQKYKDIFGPVSGLRTVNPMDSRAQLLDAYIFKVRQVIGKAMEGGVLRKEDEVKYEKMMPRARDSWPVAQGKATLMSRHLSEDIQGWLNALKAQGYSIEGVSSGVIPKSKASGSGKIRFRRKSNGKTYEVPKDRSDVINKMRGNSDFEEM